MSDLYNPSLSLVYNEQARKQIKKHEGYRPGIYGDSFGVPTGGYGHAFLIGSQLPSYVWDVIFDYDFSTALDEAMDLISQQNWQMIGYVRRNVLVEMIYNMGLSGVLRFKNMIEAIDKQDYEAAADEMLHSVWANQVGSRAATLANQMRRGSL